jgi:putative ABC transport system permease protein
VAHTYNSDITIAIDAQPYQPLHTLLAEVSNVAIIEPRLVQTVQLPQIYHGQLDLVGLQPDTRIYQPRLVAGRWLTNDASHTLVLSDIAATTLNLHVGSELAFQNNQRLERWQVVGIVHDLNKGLGKTIGVGYTNIQLLNGLDNAPLNLTSELLVRAKDRSQAAVDTLAKNLYAALTLNGKATQVTTLQQQIQQNQGPAQIVYAIFDLVAVVVALVGILELFGTLSSSVLERRLEIGILRSLGASSKQVASVFLVEGLTLALLAWLLGIAIGIPGAYGLVLMLSQQLVPLDFLFNPWLLLTTLLLILLIVMLASSGPVLSASRLHIRELLRYE